MIWNRNTFRFAGVFTLCSVLSAGVVGCSVSKSRSEHSGESRDSGDCIVNESPFVGRNRAALQPPAIANLYPLPPQSWPQETQVQPETGFVPSDMPALGTPATLPNTNTPPRQLAAEQGWNEQRSENSLSGSSQLNDHQFGRLPGQRSIETFDQDEAAWTAEQALLRLREAGVVVSFDDRREVISIDGRELQLSVADIRLFAAFTELRQLNLQGTQIPPAGLAVLSRLTRLEFLGLGQTSISDGELRSLRSLTALRFLSLAETKVSDDAVGSLASLTSLEGLNLKGTLVTPTGVAELRRQLPKCRVVSDAGVVQAESLFEQSLRSPINQAATSRDAFDSRDPRMVTRTSYDSQLRGVPAGMNLEGSAEERLRKTLVTRLADPEVQLALADVEAENGNWESAYLVYRSLSEAAPNDRAIRFRVGQAMAALGDPEGARREYVLALGPAGSHYQIARQHYEARRFQECRRELRESLMWDSNYAPSRELLSLMSAEARESERNGRSDSYGQTSREQATVDRLLQALIGDRGDREAVHSPPPTSNSVRPEWNVEISPQSRGRNHDDGPRASTHPRPGMAPPLDYDSASPYARSYARDDVPPDPPPLGRSYDSPYRSTPGPSQDSLYGPSDRSYRR